MKEVLENVLENTWSKSFYSSSNLDISLSFLGTLLIPDFSLFSPYFPQNLFWSLQMDDADRLQVNQVENDFLTWITAASIFLAAAIVIRNYDCYGKYYSLTFFVITIGIFTTALVDYWSERKRLKEKHIKVFWRMDILFFFILITIIVCLAILYNNFNSLGIMEN